MSKIKIESGTGWAKVFVDGRQLTHLTRLAVDFANLRVPEVAVSIHMHESSIDMDGAKLRVDGLEAPKELEEALLRHLSEKYTLRDVHRVCAEIPADPQPIEQVKCRRW